jgi:hypothetical protein
MDHRKFYGNFDRMIIVVSQTMWKGGKQ